MKKILFCILDGFGYSASELGNATIEASYISKLIKSKNTVFLKASGCDVGLPDGQFGNSEVGHLTIGSGRVLKQKLPLISDSIKSKEIETNPKLLQFFEDNHKTCHVLGLFSKGGVHSDIDHFFWAINFLRKKNINIKAHLFLDGRDVGYRDALDTLSSALKQGRIRRSEIATIQGRFFAMDRDKRWDRTKKAYDAMIQGIAEFETDDPIQIIKEFYNKNINDETIPPFKMQGYTGANKDDLFWMLNFRTDRIKQILTILLDNNFKTMTMVDCGDEIDSRSAAILFPAVDVSNTLGEVLSKNEISQLRIAETEKYAHVTYFFNGGKEIQYEKEDRVLISSPKVKDYSETPDMSASQITTKVIEAMENSSYQVIIVNFANADMVGHTGNFEATKQSLKYLDDHIKELVSVAKKNGYITILSADHGNAEIMLNEDGTPKKTHTCSLVPFIMIPETIKVKERGSLADISPTILKILEIEQPVEMTGESIV